MCDNSLLEDLERYRRNNVELAVALNDLKTEFNIVQMQLLEKNRNLQQVYDENATLKQSIAQKDSQLSAWRALIIDLVTTNTRKYTELMQKVGLVPAENGTSSTNVSTKTDPNTTTKVTPTEESNDRVTLHRRQRQNDDYSPTRLPDLTEESINSQLNGSRSLTTSPELHPNNHVTARRRVSVPPMTPASPLREIQQRLVESGKPKVKKPSAKVQKMERIDDENTHTNEIHGNGRKSQRKAAPKSLAEPKLGTKLRRE